MPYKSLHHFISVLESAGELVRVKEFVSPRLEISEINDRVVKNHGKALLFENNGTGFPVLVNAFGSGKRICLALGVNNLDDVGSEIGHILDEFMGPMESFIQKLKVLPALKEIVSWMPKAIGGKGLCQEVIMPAPDLTKLPVLTCWPADGGPFITLPVVHTRDPLTGMRNVGMYRMQVFGPDLTAMHWHMHKDSARHFLKYKELHRKMPVTVTLGGDPVYTYAASAPLPENLDEYLFAGFLRKKKVELVKCLTNNLEVPEDADFVIEGYIDPDEDPILEGPFGDHTGFYSLSDYFPKFHVTCITHREGAVYPATIVGIPPMEDEWIGKATERIFLVPMQTSIVRELRDMDMPVEGIFHNLALVRIEKTYPGQGLKVMNSLWGAGQMMFNKILAVFSREIDLHDYEEVARVLTETVDPLQDIHFIKGPLDILDHSSRRYAFGSKMGIDATEKTGEEYDNKPLSPVDPFVDINGIKTAFPGIISSVNDSLLGKGISVLVLSVKKNRPGHIREISRQLVVEEWIRDVRFVLFMDAEIDIGKVPDVVWIGANNIDPMRDCFHIFPDGQAPYPGLFMDGTRKTREFDNFERDWPNVILMDDETILAVDRKWDNLGLGPFIPSPSVHYKSLVVNKGAVML